MREHINNLIPSMYEWPRYSDGEPLQHNSEFRYDGNVYRLWSVEFNSLGLPKITTFGDSIIRLCRGQRLDRVKENRDDDESRATIEEVISSIDTLLEGCPKRKLSWVKVSSMTLSCIKSKLKEAIGENEG